MEIVSIKRGGGVRRLILNFHFVFRNTSLMDEGVSQQLTLHLLRKMELLPQLHIDTIFLAEIGSLLTKIFNLNFQNKSKRIWAMPKRPMNFLSPTSQRMG